jgi:hypothetical protein
VVLNFGTYPRVDQIARIDARFISARPITRASDRTKAVASDAPTRPGMVAPDELGWSTKPRRARRTGQPVADADRESSFGVVETMGLVSAGLAWQN